MWYESKTHFLPFVISADRGTEEQLAALLLNAGEIIEYWDQTEL